MGIIRKEIERMRKDEAVICHRCHGSEFKFIEKYGIIYDKNGFAKCPFCGSILKLGIHSFEELSRLIKKGKENRLNKKIGWWRRDLASLEDAERELLRRKNQMNQNN